MKKINRGGTAFQDKLDDQAIEKLKLLDQQFESVHNEGVTVAFLALSEKTTGLFAQWGTNWSAASWRTRLASLEAKGLVIVTVRRNGVKLYRLRTVVK